MVRPFPPPLQPVFATQQALAHVQPPVGPESGGLRRSPEGGSLYSPGMTMTGKMSPIVKKSEHSQRIPGVLPQNSVSNMTSRPFPFDLTTVQDVPPSMPNPPLSRSPAPRTSRPQRPHGPNQELKAGLTPPFLQTAGIYTPEIPTPHVPASFSRPKPQLMEPISFSPVSHHVLDSQIVETASFSGPKSHFMETASFSGPTPKIVEAISFSDHTPSFSPLISFEGENSLHIPEN